MDNYTTSTISHNSRLVIDSDIDIMFASCNNIALVNLFSLLYLVISRNSRLVIDDDIYIMFASRNIIIHYC